MTEILNERDYDFMHMEEFEAWLASEGIKAPYWVLNWARRNFEGKRSYQHTWEVEHEK